MLKAIIYCFLFFVLLTASHAQTLNLDSLNKVIDQLPADLFAFRNMQRISSNVAFSKPALALSIDQRILERARNLNFSFGEAYSLNSIGEDFHFQGKYADALRMQLEALRLFQGLKDGPGEAFTLPRIGILYNELDEYPQALTYLLRADSIYQHFPHLKNRAFALANLSNSYDSLGRHDLAFYYAHEAYRVYGDSAFSHLKSFILGIMGTQYEKMGKQDSALFFYNAAIRTADSADDQLNKLQSLNSIANLYYLRRSYDSSLFYARWAFQDARQMPRWRDMLRSANTLANLFEHAKLLDSANIYLKTSAAMKDSLYGSDKLNELQVLLLNDQQRRYENQQQETEYKNRTRYIFLFVALTIFLIIAYILYRSNRIKAKANDLLQKQKKKIEETLAELKSAQAQLIQSEKMASLGELTAGIAHEIQNPLNFVNNFAEINSELIVELQAAARSGNEQEILSTSENLDKNMQKISEHGKRADSIVKGMLQHSRTSTGQKEPTDLNALCDEYLRLAYHGMRAKDKTFNTEWKTNFDPAISKIQTVQQDLGRVLLNLFNNAFYAVAQKANHSLDGYSPLVIITTKKEKDQVSINVRDNGVGIPDKLKDKIFQPFFTTKPAGQGTGLGLSLSYDMIRAQGGEIRAISVEGEGAEFVVSLPVS